MTGMVRRDRLVLVVFCLGAFAFPSTLWWASYTAGRESQARADQARMARMELCDAINENRTILRAVLLVRRDIQPPLPQEFYNATLPLTEPIDCQTKEEK